MKRGGPLKRKAWLSRGGPIERKPRKERKPRAPRQPRKPRKPLKKKGSRRKREEPLLHHFRVTVYDRCQAGSDRFGQCELCRGWSWIEAHHLVGRGRAADWFRLHDPHVNGMGLCEACHRDCTLDPYLAGPMFFRAMAIWRQDRRRS